MLSRLRLDDVAISVALKGAFALTLAASVAFYFHWSLFWWAIFISFLSIQPDIGSAIMMSIARLTGTYVGGIVATIISLFYQFSSIYYILIIIFIFVTIFYSLKEDVSWAGILCLVTGVACLLIGPRYPQGVIYYAIERCMQITFALTVVFVTLTVLKAPSAHKILRVRIVDTLKKFETLWPLVRKALAQPSEQISANIQVMVREISVEINGMSTLLNFSRYEFWKKNFNSGQCLQLIRLMKRLLALFTSLKEVSRYVDLGDLAGETQEFIEKMDAKVISSLQQIENLISTTALTYDVKVDEVEKEFSDLMDRRLAHYLKNHEEKGEIDLNKVAWFSLVERLFYIFSMFRRISVLMNGNKENTKLTHVLDKEMKWLKGEEKKRVRFSPIRWRTAAHVALASAFMIWWQHYFHWSRMFGMMSILACMFIALSLVLPITGNIGLGMLGGILGAVYSLIALTVLKYYPEFYLVLGFLFVGTVIAGYLLTLSKVYGKPFLIFSVYFGIVVIYSLTIIPSRRGNLDIGIFVPIALLMGTVSFVIISHLIFPCNYRKLLQLSLGNMLKNEATFVGKLVDSAIKPDFLQAWTFHLTQGINKVRTYIKYCADQEIYNAAQIQKIHQVTYSCSLMTLTNLSLMHPYRVLDDYQYVGEFYRCNCSELRKIADNLRAYAVCIEKNNWSTALIEDVSKSKINIETALKNLLPKVLASENYIQQLRSLSLLYNGFHRLFDVQIRLLQIKGFKF